MTNNKKILLVEEKVKTQKKDGKLGINLIYQKKSLPRRGTNHTSFLSSVMAKSSHLRGDVANINKIKMNKNKWISVKVEWI